MILKEIRISNFKSIDSLHLTNLGRMNIFVGKNNTGKSTILDGIQFLLDSFPKGLSFQTSLHDQAWPGGRREEPIEFKAGFILDRSDIEFLSTDHGYFRNNLAPYRQDESLSIGQPTISLGATLGSDGSWQITDFYVLSNTLIADSSKSAASDKIFELFTRLPHSFKRLDVVRGHIPTPNAGIGMRDTLIPKKSLDTIKDWLDSETSEGQINFERLNAIFRHLTGEKWPLVQVGNHLKVDDGKYQAAVRSVGGGIQEMIQLAYELVAKASFIMIEEPEAHSHPTQTRRIFSVLNELSNDSQVFVTTHSTVFVKLADLVQVYQVSKKDNHTICSFTEPHNFGVIATQLGLSPVDIYMTAGLVFVEGESDAIVLQHWARLFGRRLEPPDVKIIPFGGVGNARYQAKIWKNVIKSIKLPMVWIFDGDTNKEILREMERVGVPQSSIVNLPRNTIEDFYPIDPLLEHLADKWGLNESKTKQLKEKLGITERVRIITEFLHAEAEIKPRKHDWKVSAARAITGQKDFSLYDDESSSKIKEIVERIHDSFGSVSK